MIVLSKRLSMIASMVSPGRTAADIGTDHAFVPIFLVEKGVVDNAIASDVRLGPIERAKEHVEVAGLSDRIALRLGDGLSTLSPGEADRVIIAGMGGKLMVKLLSDAWSVTEQTPELVLSPHRDIPEVRQFLLSRGFTIADEGMIEEDGKFYVSIRAVKAAGSSAEKTLSAVPDEDVSDALLFGPVLLQKRPETFLKWLGFELSTTEAVIAKFSAAEKTTRNERLLFEKQAYKDRVERVLLDG